MPQLRRAIAGHFRSWFDEIEQREKDPYYLMNSRI
jgi:hypothetical protein